MSSITPKHLAIYYGYPSLVNGANGNIQAAISTFSAYDIVVFGDGLESQTHPDNANTVAIITGLNSAKTQVFGYINSTLPLDTIQTNIDLWATMGVAGIFCDQFGYDYSVTRATQREIVWCAHARLSTSNSPLKAFVNASNVDDVFSPAVNPTMNPNGLITRLGPDDLYLAESFAVNNGLFDDTDTNNNGIKDFEDKAIKMASYRVTYSTKMAAVATAGNIAFAQNLADYSYFAAVANAFDYWGWGEQYYSASSTSLPFRTRATLYGTAFTNSISNNAGIIQIRTNIGIYVDTNAHTVSTILS